MTSSMNGRPSRPIHSLVLDTAPLLTTPYGQIKSLNATHYYTVPLAKEEVKDETARAALQIWGAELRVRQPLAKSIKEVSEFAKKTGDYEVLSRADVHILALTYELECELNKGDWRLYTEPGSREKRGPAPPPRPQIYSSSSMSESASESMAYDDEDTRSIITSATITPSESASEIFNNPFNVLKPPSSSGSSTPRSHSVSKLPYFTADNDSILTDQLSTTSTAKATLNSSFYHHPASAPSVITTESLVSPRSGAPKDWATQSDNEDEEEETTTPTSHSPQTSFEKSLKTLSLTDEDYYDNDDDDDGAGIWITPSNVRKHKIRDFTTTNSYPTNTTSNNNKLNHYPVIARSPPQYREQRRRSSASDRVGNPVGAVMKSACMTGDFAMQNVALQMGLNLVSVEGSERIKSVKIWVLRCHGCFTITKKMDLKFCPSCGGDTLLRTSTSTNGNGEVTVHLKKNMQWTNRGTKFSLPKPAGMSATPSLSAPPPILRGDQKEYVHATEHRKKREKDLMDPDNLPAFLFDGAGSGNGGSFGFGGRSSGRVGGGRGRGTNAVRRH